MPAASKARIVLGTGASVEVRPRFDVQDFVSAMRWMAEEKTAHRVNKVMQMLKLGNQATFKAVRAHLFRMCAVDLVLHNSCNIYARICGKYADPATTCQVFCVDNTPQFGDPVEIDLFFGQRKKDEEEEEEEKESLCDTFKQICAGVTVMGVLLWVGTALLPL